MPKPLHLFTARSPVGAPLLAVIIRSIAPGLLGKELTAEEVTLDHHLTTVTMIAFEAAAFRDAKALHQFAKMNQMGGFLVDHILPLVGPLIAWRYHSRFMAKHPDALAVGAAVDQLRQLQGDREWFSGDRLGLGDVLVYGTLAPFLEAGMGFAHRELDRAGMMTWYKRVAEAVPPCRIFPDDQPSVAFHADGSH